MSSNWRSGKERSFSWIIELCMQIAQSIGRRSSHLLLYLFIIYFWIFSVDSKRASLDYLSRILDRKAKLSDVFRHFHTFGSALLDRMFLREWEKDLSIKVFGESILREISKQGTGCLLLGSHLGSFEIVRILGVLKGDISIKVLMYEENDANSNAVFNKVYPEVANTVIKMGESFSLLKVKELVDEGHMIAILADRVFNENKSVSCQFLNSEAEFPTGPIIMAGALKIPVILFFGLYCGGNKYEIYFEKLSDKIDLSRDNRSQELQKWVQLYADRLEFFTRKAPFNWFNFYDFWRDRG
ncbi:MAG: lipid A biosynthesis acyltransferase [Nitrospinales bacterium]